jgi:hypothetical protein
MEGKSIMAVIWNTTPARLAKPINLGPRLRAELHLELDQLVDELEIAPEARRMEIGTRIVAIRNLLSGVSS